MYTVYVLVQRDLIRQFAEDILKCILSKESIYPIHFNQIVFLSI